MRPPVISSHSGIGDKENPEAGIILNEAVVQYFQTYGEKKCGFQPFKKDDVLRQYII